MRMRTTFEDGEDELKVAGLLDAEVVQPGDEPGDGDGEDLRPEQGNRAADGLRSEPVEGRKELQRAGQADGDGGDGGGLGHGEPGPHVEEGGRVAVGAAQVDILAAGIGQHGAQLGIGHGAEKREQPAHDPGQVDQRGGADILHHLAGDKKDAAADDGAHHDGRGLAGAQDAGQIGGGTSQSF